MNGQLAQNIPQNANNFSKAVKIGNPGDEGLLDSLVNPAIGMSSSC